MSILSRTLSHLETPRDIWTILYSFKYNRPWTIWWISTGRRVCFLVQHNINKDNFSSNSSPRAYFSYLGSFLNNWHLVHILLWQPRVTRWKPYYSTGHKRYRIGMSLQIHFRTRRRTKAWWKSCFCRRSIKSFQWYGCKTISRGRGWVSRGIEIHQLHNLRLELLADLRAHRYRFLYGLHRSYWHHWHHPQLPT